MRIGLRRVASAVEEAEVDEIARLGPPEDARELRCAEIGERFDDDAVYRRWWRLDVRDRFEDDIELEPVLRRRHLGPHERAGVTDDPQSSGRLARDVIELANEIANLVGPVAEEIEITGEPVREIHAAQRGAAAKVAGDASLARAHECEHFVRNDAAIERAKHVPASVRAGAAARGQGGTPTSRALVRGSETRRAMPRG